MVDVSLADLHQADAHLLTAADGTTMLIDVGTAEAFEQRLLPLLDDLGVSRVDKVFITHAHRDHYGGLAPLIASEIKVGEVFFAPPSAAACDRERPWGCVMEEVEATIEAVEEAGVPIRAAPVGETFSVGEGTLAILFGFDGETTPVGPTDVNDTSLIMRLDVGERSVLFTGDLNEALGGWLADQPLELGGERILKVPHHGAEGLAPNEFFAVVDPVLAFVPAPLSLWCGERSQRPRTWFESKGVPVYVSGDDGHVVIDLSADELSVQTERSPRGCT